MISQRVRDIAQREGAPEEIKQLDSAFTQINNISVEAKVVLVDTCLMHDDAAQSLQTLVDIFGGGLLVDYFAASRKHHITVSQRVELLDLSLAQDQQGLIDKFLSLIN